MNEAAHTTGQPAAREEWNDALMSRWWHRMGEVFGKSWYEHNGPEPTTMWRAELKKISLDHAALIIDHYAKQGGAFPPNLPQMVAAAKYIARNCKPYIRPTKRLTLPPPTDPEAGIEQIAKLKSILRGEPTP